ncbi:TIGR01212 family radical SAM protein [Spirochaetia bacterium 38H-sp]|uniref:TIGR01212 family radical SAM protein n=1 Tax=Rarispira pelagica TaxID=3141764 RepID=A0ABU9UBN6_9SPIR
MMSNLTANRPFFSFSDYLRKRYGERIYRVGVDAGFSCPHRKDTYGGCAFCDAAGSRAPYLDVAKGLKEQIDRTIIFLKKRYNATGFFLYFQANTNTYAPANRLRELYDYALSLASFKGLIVSTRPDCLDDKKTSLLADYKKQGYEVWVELGLQSMHDKTLARINRGHDRACWEEAIHRLGNAGIYRAAHLIAGLPGEDLSDFLASVNYVAKTGTEAVKLHDLHLPLGSALYKEFLHGELSLLSRQRYIDYVIAAIEHMPKDMILMRYSTDTTYARRGYPHKYIPKQAFIVMMERKLKSLGTYQGRLWKGGERNTLLSDFINK